MESSAEDVENIGASGVGRDASRLADEADLVQIKVTPIEMGGFAEPH